MKISFLEHMEKIFEYVLRETKPENMIDILNEKIKDMTESCVIERDIGNFIAYFEYVLSTNSIPSKLEFNRNLVQAFIDRTHAGLASPELGHRVERLYEYLENKIGKDAAITGDRLRKMTEELNEMRKPTLEKIMERIRVATILKWLQGPLKESLSHELQDYIILLATVYGQYRKNLLISVGWSPYQVSAEDMNKLVSEYRILEIAIIEALRTVRDARASNPDLGKYEEQFQIVFSSLDNLIKFEETGRLDSFDSFKDKLIISTALIYIQDDFVQKDAELTKLIQLFVSLYFKFRDKYQKSDTSIKEDNKLASTK